MQVLGHGKISAQIIFSFVVLSILMKLSLQIAEDLLDLRSGEFCGHAR